MPNGTQPLESFGAFRAPAEAALETLRRSRVGQRRRLIQNLATRGVRGAGVSEIPLAEFRRGGREAELGVLTRFGTEAGREAGLLRRQAIQREFDIKQGELGRALAERASKRRLAGQLIGGGIAGVGAGLAASDGRLKDNVKVLDSIEGIEVVSFTWNDEGEKHGYVKGIQEYGVIAQQVAPIIPEAVIENNGIRLVDYRKLPTSVREKIKDLRTLELFAGGVC